MAQSYIPTDSYFSNLPKGMVKSTTPQGGTAYKDTEGNMYLPESGGGLRLAPSTLPTNNIQPPGPGEGLNPVSKAQPVSDISTLPGVTSSGAVSPAIKSALEANANAGASSIGNVPTTKTTPTIDYTLHQGETIDQYNARIAEEKSAAGVSTDTSKVGISEILANIQPPTAPDMNTVQSNAETEYNVSGLQQNVQTLTSNLTNLENDLQNRQASEASKPGVVATIINGRMQMLSAQDSKALNDLKLQISDATKQLTNANTAVSTIMKNTLTDYNNAEKQYDDAYNNAIKLYTTEETQNNKAQTSAKANAQVIINSYKGSSIGFN